MECKKNGTCDDQMMQQQTTVDQGLVNLEDLSDEELKRFLDSFDNVMSDCDGVIWHNDDPIEGVDQTMKLLRSQGKQINFISNNGTMGIKGIFDKLTNARVGAKLDDVIVPTTAVIAHLKAINFNQKIFLFGSELMRKDLMDAGFDVAELRAIHITDFNDLFNLVYEDETVGAVVFDFDLNINFVNIQQAAVLLRRPEVHYIVGSADEYVPFKPNINVMGPKMFINLLAQLSGKEPKIFGKPSLNLNEYIVNKYNIKDASRTLFVGDSLQSDMPFANLSGFTKLLVLSGISSLEDAKAKAGSESYPDYYVRNLGVLGKMMQRLYRGEGKAGGVKNGINTGIKNGIIKVG